MLEMIEMVGGHRMDSSLQRQAGSGSCNRSGLAPCGMQSAFTFLIGFGGIEVIPFVWQLVGAQVSVELGVRVIEKRTDLERAEIRVVRNDIQAGAVGILHLTQGCDPDSRSQ